MSPEKGNGIFLVIPQVAEVRLDLVDSLGVALAGLAPSSSDHPFGVVGPQHSEVLGVATGWSYLPPSLVADPEPQS
jgi:hypothetical protein